MRCSKLENRVMIGGIVFFLKHPTDMYACHGRFHCISKPGTAMTGSDHTWKQEGEAEEEAEAVVQRLNVPLYLAV